MSARPTLDLLADDWEGDLRKATAEIGFRVEDHREWPRLAALRAALAADESTTTEWGVRLPDGRVVTSQGGWRGPNAARHAQAQAALNGATPVSRQRTSYADHVTDWAPADEVTS